MSFVKLPIPEKFMSRKLAVFSAGVSVLVAFPALAEPIVFLTIAAIAGQALVDVAHEFRGADKPEEQDKESKP